ncbi:MAG: TIGR04283 family arsenosugar biosynthesis glycosyltransferase [Balneolaceae bacterium]
MKISVIIPTYNEEERIQRLVSYLKQCGTGYDLELIVVDGQSTDQTVNKIRESETKIILSEKKGRAAQMNSGVRHSTGQILYFVHADATPPSSFPKDILKALEEGYNAGCYRFIFDSSHPLLKINAFCTRFDRLMCRGGDQTLFVTRSLFEELGGYKDHYRIMEDFDLIERIQEHGRFKIIPKNVTVSARKYKKNGYLTVNIANLIVFLMYFAGASQTKLVHTYKRLIDHSKFN